MLICSTCSFQLKAYSFIAGVGFEPTTSGLWAQRAATAPPRYIYRSGDDSTKEVINQVNKLKPLLKSL